MFNCGFPQFSVLVLAKSKTLMADKISTCTDLDIGIFLVNMDI
jgi:hypothetical protein